MINNPPKILVIKSKYSELKRVEQFVNELFTECNISPEYFNKVYLCISEAVINSIKHGNKFDIKKVVSIVARYGNKKLNVEVSDEGEGFNPKEVENPTTKKNIKKESGRGIFIIKSLAKQIKFNEKGNSVHFKIVC